MSKGAYHTNDEGKTLPCDNPDNCPFGAYDTPGEAQKAYETKMSEQSIPTVSKKTGTKVKQTELNNIAKTSDNPDELDRAIELGSNRVLSNLAKNPNVTGEQLLRIMDKTDDIYVKRAAFNNNNYPLDKLSVEELRKRPYKVLEATAESDNLDDTMAEKLINITNPRGIFENHNNKLTAEKITELTKNYKYFSNIYRFVKDNPKFDLKKVISEVSDSDLGSICRNATNPEDIRIVYKEAELRGSIDNTSYSYILYNKNTPSDVIDKISEDEIRMKNPDIGLAIYRNPNASDDAKEKALKSSDVAVSMKKLDELSDSGKLDEIFDNATSGWRGRQQGYNFNTDKVKEFGLNGKDIDTLVRHRFGNYLFGTSYNEKTGEYTGWID